MKLWAYWPLVILLPALTGCGGNSTTPAGGQKSAAEWIESGNAALAQTDLRGALAAFNSAVGAAPDAAQPLERRAAVYVEMRKLDQAVYDCNAALKIDGKLAAAYFTRGLAEKRMGNSTKAVEDFTQAIDNGLERVDVLTERGMLHHALAAACVDPDEAAKIRQKALKDFDRAVNLAPALPRPLVQRARLKLDLDDYEGAVADCDAALTADSKLAEALVYRARGECERGEIERAIADCDAAIQQDPGRMEAYVARGKARLEKAAGMRTVAEVAECRLVAADCQAGIERAKRFQGDPQDMGRVKKVCALAHEFRGAMYHNLSATQKALAEYEQALSLDPILVSALIRRAITRSATEDYTGALSDCNTAVNLDSSRPEAYAGRGMVYLMKADLPKAVENFTQAVSLDRKCAKAFWGRASAYSVMASLAIEQARHPASKQDYDICQRSATEFQRKCIEDSTAAIAANRHLARAYVTRGLCYAKQQVLDKALDDFNAAIREDPKLAKAYYNRGVLLVKGNLQLDDAIHDFEAARELQPENANPDLRLCQIYEQKRDPVLFNKYRTSWREKVAKGHQEQESLLEDIFFKPKKDGELRPDVNLPPLETAKRELEHTLDATAEKE